MSLDISHFYFNTASHVFTINGYETSLPPKKSKRKDSLHASGMTTMSF